MHLVCGFDAHFSGSQAGGLRAEEGWQHLQMMNIWSGIRAGLGDLVREEIGCPRKDGIQGTGEEIRCSKEKGQDIH